jgi:hypothetical protein
MQSNYIGNQKSMSEAPNLSIRKRGAPVGNQNRRKAIKRQAVSTTVSQETLDYIKSLRDEMTPGELIDMAIKLYRDAQKNQR